MNDGTQVQPVGRAQKDRNGLASILVEMQEQARQEKELYGEFETFAPPQAVCEQPTDRRKFSLVRLNEIAFSAPEWLVRDFLTTDSLGMLFSDPGTSKTFLAITVGCCVATGTHFFGHKTKQAPVVFIAGEGHNGLKKRFMAWSIRHQVSLDEAPLFISIAPAAFLEPGSFAEVLGEVDDVASEYGPPGLIVIDTLARNFGPGDENNTSDMGIFVQAADQLRAKYHAAILLVHHSGHGDKTRARGAMALKGALDFEYRLTRGDDDVIRVDCTKIKDFEPPQPMAFRLRSVELPLQDENGQTVTSAALDVTNYEAPPKPGKAGRGKNQTKALETLKNLFEHHRANLEQDGRDPAGARVTLDEWQTECKIKARMERNRFKEVQRSLEDAGTVAIENGFVSLA